MGTSEDDVAYGGVSADGLGNAYISGYTQGSFGAVQAGVGDAFVSKISDVPEPNTASLVLIAGAFLLAFRGLSQIRTV